MTGLLHTQGLTAFYGDFQALFGVDITVGEGQAVAIIGANGAGKTTFLRAITGMLPAAGGDVTFEGRSIKGLPEHEVVRLGIAMVPEGRRLFPSLTVEENIRIGEAAGRRGRWTLEAVYELFEPLKDRRHAPATVLSGGQQQMVAIGRALMANPRLLLCDEISLGLSPLVIRGIYMALPAIRAGGCSVIVVEQDINRALAGADQVYCLQEGRVTLAGHPSEFSRDQIKIAYFGM